MNEQEVLELLADFVSDELEMRKLHVHLDDIEGTLLKRGNGRHQIYLMHEFYPVKGAGREDVKEWAKELGIKLARPFDMTSYPLELPEGTRWANSIVRNGLFIRGISDYNINEDNFLIRFDMLIRWNDK